MKKLSKLLSILLCLAMVIGIFTMAVSATDTYTRVTNLADITAGGEFVIVLAGETHGLGTSIDTKFVSTTVQVNAARNTVTTSAPPVWTVVASSTADCIYLQSGNNFLAYNSSTNFKSSADGYDWKVVEGSNGTFILKANATIGNGTERAITYRKGTTNKWAPYGTSNATGQSTCEYWNELEFYKKDTGSAPAPTVNVTGVTLDKATATIQAGLSTTLTATVAPSDATNKKVTWTSSDETVATVANGKVTAVKVGTATITATTEDGNKTATCAVTVTAAPVMANAPTAGSSYKLGLAQKGLGKYLWFSGEMDGNYLATTENFNEAVDVIPVAVEGGWHISFVKNNVTKYIEIYEYQAGSVGVHITDEPTTVHTWDATAKTFFAALADKVRYLGTYGTYDTISTSDTYRITGSNASALDVSQYVAHLYPIALTGVTLDKTSQNMTVGGTVDLVATVAPNNATNKAVTWTSSNTAVATVANGTVTAVAPGTATITVTTAEGGKTATCEITVVAATVPATGVTLNKTSETLNVGGEVNLSATVAPADTTDTVTWTTSNAAVATVAGGKVTAVGVGTATITATAGDKTATCTITVAVAVSKVELDKTTASMTVGGEANLTATVTVNPNTDTYKNVTWTTSDATVATVENGKVKALKAGTVTITATSVTDTTKKATCTVTITEPAVSTNEGKITSKDQLVTGTYVLVVDSGYAAGALDGTWVTFVQPTIANDKVTDAKGGIWTLTVNTDGTVTIADANGKTIAPQGGGKNNVKEGECNWTVAFKDGKFTFSAVSGENTHYLTSNITAGQDYTNKFRAYKESSINNAPDSYLTEFTLYAVASSGGSDSGNTGNENTGSGNTGNENTGNGSTGSGSTGSENTGSGNTGNENTGSGNTGNENTGSGSSETVKTEYTVQSTPTAGKAFKYGLYQGTNKTQLWFTGEMDGYYLAMSQDVKDAVDVTVETVEGGYRLSFTKDGVKKYIDVVERTDKAGSANVVITDEPTAVLTWDATAKTFFAKIGENTFYLGTYSSYKTISASNVSYITGDNASKVDVSQYVSHLYLDQPSSTGDAFEPMVIILALASVSALAVLVLNKKKFIF